VKFNINTKLKICELKYLNYNYAPECIEQLWHGLAKTLAEKTAWALARDRGVNMVSVNAGLLVGPDLTIDNPYLKGAAEMYESGLFVTVDLNYLVEAHIRVFQDLSSYGRYICFNHVINTNDDAADLARKLTSLPPGLVPFFIYLFSFPLFLIYLLFIF